MALSHEMEIIEEEEEEEEEGAATYLAIYLEAKVCLL